MGRTAREVIFEFQQIGNVVKATAIDTATGIEASTMGPATSGEEALKRVALRKLQYVMEKRSGGR